MFEIYCTGHEMKKFIKANGVFEHIAKKLEILKYITRPFHQA